MKVPDPYSSVMGIMKKSGTRDELVSELNEDAGYWGFIGNDKNITAAVDGAKALENGASSVKVGHTEYLVVAETSDGDHTER